MLRHMELRLNADLNLPRPRGQPPKAMSQQPGFHVRYGLGDPEYVDAQGRTSAALDDYKALNYFISVDPARPGTIDNPQRDWDSADRDMLAL